MIAKNTDSFVLGQDEYPDWFREFSQKNLLIFHNSGEEYLLTIQNPTGFVHAKNGDVLMRIQNSIVVVPQNAAKKFMRR